MNKCLVITGMHRSHTSYVTQCLERAGLELGDLLIEGNEFNQEGHFEDQGIVAFHEELMTKNNLRNKWKGINTELLNTINYSEQDIEEANKLILRLQENNKDYGWKDPRGALFLPFWHNLFPSNYYLFVIRNPVACVNSLLRRSKRNSKYTFRPLLAYALFNYWNNTNERILTFANAHPDRCIVISALEDLTSRERCQAINNKIRNQWKFHLDEIDFASSFNAKLVRSANPPFYLNSIYRIRKSTQSIYQKLLALR